MEQIKRVIKVLTYSEYPGPRYCTQGDFSGEDFYHQQLNERFSQSVSLSSTLIVDLDDTAGYASSFLDEAFGNLVFDFSLEVVKKYLEVISKQEPDWKEMIFNDVFHDWEERRIEDKTPKKTVAHDPWYRLKSGHLVKEKWL